MNKMPKRGTIRQFRERHRGFSYVLLLEMTVMFVLLLSSVRKPAAYVLDGTNMILNDQSAVICETGELFVTGRNDAEPFPRTVAGSGKLHLPRGMYELEVKYHSAAGAGGNYDDIAGAVRLASAENGSGLQCNDIVLRDSSTNAADRVWVRSLTGIRDLEVSVWFHGTGDLYLADIAVRELPVWRITCILAWLLGFVAADAAYLYFFTENAYRNKPAAAGLLATVFLSSLPLFTDSLFYAHDLQFHVLRIWALAEGIQNGHWIVPIQTELLNGYGYAAPLFYSQLFLYVPAVLYCMAVPLQVCYQAYILLVNAATCLICYCCMKGLLKDGNLAVFASFLYTLSAYRIADVYVRAAIGEFTAMAFFPLAVYGFARIYMTEGKKLTWKDYLPVVAGLSGIMQSHVLSCELSAFFIAALCILCIRKTLQPQRLFALVKAALLTVGVNLAFLIPFLQSMQMELEVRSGGVNEIQQHGTYLMQVLGLFMTSIGDSREGMTGDMPLAIGFSLVIGLMVWLYCCAQKYAWKLEQDERMRVGLFCAGFAMASILFSTRVFPWDSLKNISTGAAEVFCMIQFPWRYLSVGTVFALFASVIGVKMLYEHKGAAAGNICCGVMAAFTLLNAGLFYMQYGNDMHTTTMYGIVDRNDYITSGEYLPAGTDSDSMNWRRIAADADVTVREYDYTDGVTTFWCSNPSEEDKAVGIPLLKYDNYHAYALTDGQELEIVNGDNNCAAVVVGPHYEGTVQVRYEIPLSWKLSYAASAVAAAGILAGIIRAGRRQKTVISR